MKRLAVYCGSATPADPRYMELARDVGAALARRGIGVVYGGGRLGLMGAVAGAALEAGGEVIGIIPEALAGSGKLIIPPGPNNPVGTTWMSLSKPGYGIHGTPDPEKVGRATSLGCFRLANWNVQRL